jgi:hypothetical protein
LPGVPITIHWPRAGALLLLTTAVVLLAQDTGVPAAAPASGQRGLEVVGNEEGPVKNGHQYVVAIGIDHYQNWPVLSTAVSDATGFARLLTSKFGFENALPPLTEKNATRRAIDSLIDDDLRTRLHPEDSLIIFFAGHGTTQNYKVSDRDADRTGYIVPWDARPPGAHEHYSDYLKVEDLLRTISTLPPAHILVILDSCHSGMALGSQFSTSRDDARFQRDVLKKWSRSVITSAQGDQVAADRGPVPDHSLFTGLMIQGLTTGKADSLRRGIRDREAAGGVCAARGGDCGGIAADSVIWVVRSGRRRRTDHPVGRGSEHQGGCGRREPGEHADHQRDQGDCADAQGRAECTGAPASRRISAQRAAGRSNCATAAKAGAACRRREAFLSDSGVGGTIRRH